MPAVATKTCWCCDRELEECERVAHLDNLEARIIRLLGVAPELDLRDDPQVARARYLAWFRGIEMLLDEAVGA